MNMVVIENLLCIIGGYIFGCISTLALMALAMSIGKYNKKVEEHDDDNNN